MRSSTMKSLKHALDVVMVPPDVCYNSTPRTRKIFITLIRVRFVVYDESSLEPPLTSARIKLLAISLVAQS